MNQDQVIDQADADQADADQADADQADADQAAADRIAALESERADLLLQLRLRERLLPGNTARALERNLRLEAFMVVTGLPGTGSGAWERIHRAFVNANPDVCYDETPPEPLGLVSIAWSRKHVISVKALRESFRRYIHRKRQAERSLAADQVA